MTIVATAVTAIKRIYPHVNEIADWQTQSTTRLLWDRVHDLEERLQAAQATITQLVAGHNTNEAGITTATATAKHALALGQPIETPIGGGGGAGSGGTAPDGGDGGDGDVGCASAGPTGHDTGGLLNAVRAGQIVCGTGNEYSALKQPTATDAERQANTIELLLRMIWHLRESGFTAGRQKNPSGALSPQKLCIVVDGVTRAYEVINGVDKSVPSPTLMEEVFPANLVDDPGIAD